MKKEYQEIYFMLLAAQEKDGFSESGYQEYLNGLLTINDLAEAFIGLFGAYFTSSVENSIQLNCEFSNSLELDPRNPYLQKYGLDYGYLTYSWDKILREETTEIGRAIAEKNDVEIIDGAFDTAVVALNIAYKAFRMKGFGHEEATAKTEEGFRRVCLNNLTKLNANGKPEFSETGKVCKPDNYKPVELDDLLEPTNLDELLKDEN